MGTKLATAMATFAAAAVLAAPAAAKGPKTGLEFLGQAKRVLADPQHRVVSFQASRRNG